MVRVQHDDLWFELALEALIVNACCIYEEGPGARNAQTMERENA